VAVSQDYQLLMEAAFLTACCSGGFVLFKDRTHRVANKYWNVSVGTKHRSIAAMAHPSRLIFCVVWAGFCKLTTCFSKQMTNKDKTNNKQITTKQNHSCGVANVADGNS
jgi:hypothetical protein